MNRIVWTGVDVVDVVLSSKMNKAKREGIRLIYNVEYPSNATIYPHDICTILTNLIDNAIEATIKGNRDKEIKVTIRKINNFLMIQVINNLFEAISIKDGKMVSSKSDSLFHGFGLQSVEDSVKKYEGSVKYNYDESHFTVTAILFY